MALSFPGSPSVGQTSTQNSRQYVWSGYAWELVAASGSGLSWSSVPASATATGTAGQIAYDGSYLYVASATNTWVRAPLSTWSLTDPQFASVSLLLHGDGNLTDSSSAARTVTAYGSAAATGTAKFGSNSLSFSGSSSYLRVAGTSAFALPGDFTLETWVYFNAAPSSYSGIYGALIMSTYPGAGVNPGWQLRINGTSSGYNNVNIYTGQNDLNWSGTFYLNQWHHVAVTRSGSTMRAWIDGVQTGSDITNSDSMTPTSTNDMWLGRLNLSSYEFQLNGLLDDVRVTKGQCRYTGTFTPPAAAFPNA